MSILFLIRDKFGDSVISACVALDYAKKKPHQKCSILIRKAYLPILKFEKNIILTAYITRPQAFLWAKLRRLFGRDYDVLCVLRGFGSQSARFTDAILAHKKIAPEHLQEFLPVDFKGVVITKPDSSKISQPLLQYSVDLIHGFDDKYQSPDKLELPVLKNKWQTSDKKIIAICPIASETRRSIIGESLITLVNSLIQKFPQFKVVVLLRDKGESIDINCENSNLPIRFYGSINNLINQLLVSANYFGVDSGHYHLSAAMGIPCTVFFGPSEPSFAVLSQQDNAKSVREDGLGEKFCENITCSKPICMKRAINKFLENSNTIQNLEDFLDGCLLEKH